MTSFPDVSSCMQAMFFSGFLARLIPFFRDRIMLDKLFLFKVFVEILIDSGKLGHILYLHRGCQEKLCSSIGS